MNIEQMKLADIIPYKGNAKKHDNRQIKNVMQSIKEYGIVQPLVIDKNNVLIIGHCRLEASKRLKLTEVPVVRLEELSEEEAQKLRLLDNKLNESEWDMDLLADQVPELNFDDFDIDWGLDIDDTPAEVTEDTVPEEVETRAKLGDLWQLGGHRLICGDSTDIKVIERLMDGIKADMVFTDPPYGVSANGGRGDTKKKLKMQDIANDDLREDDLCDFLQSSFAIMPIKEGASIYICYPWATQEEFTKAIKNCGYTLQNCIIWRKNVFGLNGFKGYRPQYEMIYFCSKADYQWYGDLAQSNVWDFDRSTEHIGGHPTVKPIELIAKALKNSSKKEDCIYDGFGGSGSTLIACEQLKRKCFMCELDPHYVDVIIQRWENLTGEKATLLNDNK